MDSKIIFLDVDGTLCNHQGVIPDSAMKACQKARQNGHLIFLSTGRSKSELTDYILSPGFDGVIGAAGGFIEVNGEMIRHTTMDSKSLTDLKNFFHKHEIDYIFESNSGLYCNTSTYSYFKQLTETNETTQKNLLLELFLKTLIVSDDLIREDINKVIFLNSPRSVSEIQEHFNDQLQVIPCSIKEFGRHSGEISLTHIHKGMAIEELVHYLGRTMQDTIAFGDSLNDLEMLEMVHLGIAMGNASETVKAYANAVTTSVDEDGLYQAFKKYHLI